MRIKRLLAARGIHYLATRFGPSWLRSMAFDEKYRRGDWNFHSDGAELPLIVSRYLRGGDLLMLGCGSASLLDSLEAPAFASVLGVDLSEEATRLASRIRRQNIAFQVGDMLRFQPPKQYDVVLFSESLYYVPATQQVEMLNRYAARLKAGGVIIVTFAQVTRYEDIIERVRGNFLMIEDRAFTGATRHLLVFQAKPDRPAAAG